MDTSLAPSIGAAVHFWPMAEADLALAVDPAQPCAAVIAYVEDEVTVTLAVLAHDGTQHVRAAVLLQPGEQASPGESYASWPADPTEAARRP